MYLSNAIKQRIINLSSKKHIKLKELCRRSNVSYSTLMGFMSKSNKTLNLSTLYDLCLGLEIDLVDFFDDQMFKDVIDEKEESKKVKSKK